MLLVSHATEQVRGFCQRCLWLDHGTLLRDGPTDEVLDAYMAMVARREDEEFRQSHPGEWEVRQSEEQERREEEERQRREAEGAALREAEARARAEREARARAERERAESERARLADPARHALTGCRLLDARGRETAVVEAGEPFSVEISYRFADRLPFPVFCLEIFRDDGLYMFATNTYLHDLDTRRMPLTGTVRLVAHAGALNAGRYRVQLHLFPDCTGDDFAARVPFEHRVESAATFEVTAGRFGGFGCAYVPARWQVGDPPMEDRAPPVAVVVTPSGTSEEIPA